MSQLIKHRKQFTNLPDQYEKLRNKAQGTI